jgi:hypothetical protein
MITHSKAKLLCLAVCLVWALPLAAEQTPRAEIMTAYRIGTTPPMAKYLATHHPVPNAPFRVFPLRKPSSKPSHGGGGGGGGTGWTTDPVLQTTPLSNMYYSTASPGFPGLGSVGYVPPDTNISVGDTQIVETVNVDYAVYDKSGTLYTNGGPAPIHSIFLAAAQAKNGGIGTSDMCATTDGGDPVVLFDKIDQRWIISQLAYNTSLSDNHFCIAISKSDDATGQYYAYDVPFGGNLPDYPKLGIWAAGSWGALDAATSGVYFSANMFSGGNTFTGAKVCGFPLGFVTNLQSTFPWYCVQNGTSVFSVLPADLEGSKVLASTTGTTIPASAGTNEYFLQFSGSNTLNLYQFNPAFGGGSPAMSSPTSITVATFHEACGGGACVPQSGRRSALLDSLGDRLMYRLSYRNYGGSIGQSMVVTQSVQDSSSSSQTGERWYQLKNTGSGWNNSQINRQGTFGSIDSNYRWMGSIAQDKVGNLGLGYSVSGSSVFPYLAVTGKTSAETGMEPETTLNSMANGAQTNVNRWGDYSSMSVDPSDDCTMWYANEYLKSTGSYTNWGTWIVGFKFTGSSTPCQ